EGTNGENLPETHGELKRLRSFLDDNYENRMLIAEANQWPEDAVAYFGDGDECHMAFHFPLMPRLYLALQRENRLPIIDILEQTPPIPEDAQWAIFLRNHDELTLEMVSEEERDFMWRVYSPDRRARLNLGIRRRLASLLEGDRRRIELLFSLLLSLPGTPVIYYGDEIGMGDNIFLEDRDGVRTPMQWSNDRNAGFSMANAQSLYLPVVVDPQFHYETVNVEAQHANPNSLLWWVRDMIRRRQRHPVFGRGAIEFLSPDNEQVLAYLREGEGETILIVANLSHHAQFVELELDRFAGLEPIEMLGRTDFPAIGDHGYPLSLGPYGFYWLSIEGADENETHDEDVIEISGPLEAAFGTDGPLVDAVRRHIALQHWISGRVPREGQASVVDLIPVTPGEQEASMWMAIVSVERSSGTDDLYVVPLAISFEEDRLAFENGDLISRIRREGVDGVLYDGLSDSRFRARMLSAIIAGETLLGEAGSLFCTTGFTPLELEPSLDMESTVTTNERGETYIKYLDGPVIKLFRHIEPGINPDLELRRFLTEFSGYENLSDVYGALEYQSGESYTVAVLQESLAAASSAMAAFGELCGSWLDAVQDQIPESEPEDGYWSSTAAVANHLPEADLLAPALGLAGRLGETTAQLHLALGSLSEDPDIRPESFSHHYQQSLYQSLRAGVRHELRAINRLAANAGPDIEASVRDIVLAERDILAWLDPIRRETVTGSRIRVHGDYRLDEVYMVDGEFVIEDFSGDHTRPVSERRLRGSALRDIAQMLRSIDYLAMSAALDGSQARKAWAAWWSRAVGGAFVTSYLATMEDSPLLPDEVTATDALLNAFAVARSLREMHWDLVNRPWLASVPLAGIRSTLGRRPSLID
ncbi:MAG: alpha-glucosidase C-terminal domain-containing protein, partial [Acidimicrobiia bacterium]